MKYLFIILFTLLVAGNISGQVKCHCDFALSNLIAKIESDYPGFEQKTKDKVLYNSFKKQLAEEAKTMEQSSCFEVLKKYTSFFRDGHIWINPATTINKKGSVTTALIDIDIDKFRKQLKTSKDPIAGIWKNRFEWTGGVVYEIGITPTGNNDYTGFVITANTGFWQPKEIKFKLFADRTFEFYTFDKTKKTGTYEISNDNIIYFKEARSSFIKESPASGFSEKQIRNKVGTFYGFSVKQLSAKTTIITLPYFDYPFVEIINDMMEEHLNLIENSENLVIDIRGNSGGTDNAYQKLLPYIMTHSIRNVGVEYLATQTLIDGLEGYIKTIKDKKGMEDEIKKVRGWINSFEKNMGKFVNVSDNPFSIQEVDLAKKSPRNIVVMIDKRVGSAAENLVMRAKQSKKVKVMGTVTSGGLDYAAARMFDFGCPEYLLQLPTYRSLRLPDFPIDNIGLQPDIFMDRFVKDWVQYAVDYLENE
ncbi:S41 family peptidase [Terrimonas rubra]|uniref:S41 family peptidase n=1 Tax=Terrimonas rubra TaxID=1035890 RepID=A0ABW6A1V4_9BACT